MSDPTFIRNAFSALGAEVREPQPGLLEVTLPPEAAPFFDDRAQLALTFDRELHKSSERDLELVVPGSPLFRSLLEALGGAGAVTSVEFTEAPDPAKAREAARGGLTLRGGTVTPGTPAVEPFNGTAVLFVLRVEGPEREDALVAAFVPRVGEAFEVPAGGVEAMARAGKPVALSTMTPGDRARLRAAAAAVAQREGDRRGQAAEKRSAGRMAKEVQQVRTYFESLGAELKEQKSDSRGEEAKKEAATRLRNLERERELRLIELQDRFRASAHVDPVAAVAISGSAARVKVVFQAGTRKLERETLWFPPVGRATPPACDLCGGPFTGATPAVAEAAICGEPAHDVLLCAACRRHCQACGAGLCPEHTKACSCGAIACPAHGAACEACAQFCCAGHSFKCVRCCRSFCRQHAFECGVCKLISCSDHSKRCGSCDIELCGEHQRPCDATGKVGCPQHMKPCEECGETVLDTALQMQKCPSCRNLAPVLPGDPAVAAAERFLPVAIGATWLKSETKTRVRLEGRTFMNKYRVWLAKDLKPLQAFGGSKLFGMRKMR
ncbi:MAG: hypothetical protein K8T20_07510 [Planctomycetes bacterium]|nr:hypothetical protein [Planctomycetota bacterium]